MGALFFGFTNIFKKEVEITTLIDNKKSNVIAKNDWVAKYGYSTTDLPNPYQGHIGLDFRASIGTPVYALGNGKVVEVDSTNNDANGLHVGYEYDGFKVVYRHLSKINVKIGDKVNSNTKIGETGDTDGANGGQPHLHVDMMGLSSGNYYDPYDWVKGEGEKNMKYYFNVLTDLKNSRYRVENADYYMVCENTAGVYRDKELTKKFDTGDFKSGQKVVSKYAGVVTKGNWKYWVHVIDENQYGNKVYFSYKREEI